MKTHILKISSLTIFALALIPQLCAQIINPNLINYEVYADEWRQECDNDWATNDDNMVRFAVTADASTGGVITWNYTGTCTTPYGYVRRWSADAPSNNAHATSVYSAVNRTNTTGQLTYTIQSWETDNGFQCLPINGDDCRWGPTSYTAIYRNAAKTPNQWWGVNGTNGTGDWTAATQGRARLKTIWRYSLGENCTSPLNFGTLASNVAKTHFNSNKAIPLGARAEMGYTNTANNAAPDVYYSFTLTQPATVTITTDDPLTNYDTYLRLFSSDCNTQIAFNDDFNGSTRSTINTTLCAGTYKIMVEGFSANTGNFNLSVLAVNIPTNGGTIANTTTTICSGTNLSNFTSTTAASGLGTITYQWQSSTTSSTTGFSNINGATSDIYNPVNIAPTQTTWYRRRATDECGRVVYSNIIQIVVQQLSGNLAINTVPALICPNTTINLTATGTLGAGGVMHWSTGPNGTGTSMGTGNSVGVSPTQTTTYYARIVGTCNTTADVSVTVNVREFDYAANNTSSNSYCTDNDGWHHYYAGSKIIYSIKGNLTGAATNFPRVTIYKNSTYYQQTEGPGIPSNCGNNVNPNEERFEMSRSWNLDFGGGTTNGTYSIRFYHLPVEKTEIENAALNHINNYPACGYDYKYGTPNGFYWFKNQGANYTPPQFDGTHFTATNGVVNGINYSEWTGLTNFSGGTGAVIVIPTFPLNIEISKFSAQCINQHNIVSFTSTNEKDLSFYMLQQSRDGINWENIEKLEPIGAENTPSNYVSLPIENPRMNENYFRLVQFNTDGSENIHGPIVSKCDYKSSLFTIFPNPASEELNFIFTNIIQNEANDMINITDAQGKIVSSISYDKLLGNGLKMNISQLPPGLYLVNIMSEKNIVATQRLIKN